MFFDSNLKFTKKESTIFLESIVGFLADGQTILKSMEYTSEIFGGKYEKIIDIIKHDVIENSISMEDSFVEYGVLDEEEAAIFSEQAENTKDIIYDILELREYGSEYEKIWWDGLRLTIYIFLATSLALFFFADDLVVKVQDLVGDSVSSEVLSFEDMDILPFYLQNKWYLIWMVGIVIFGTFIFKKLYWHLYNTNRKVIYGVFSKKSYDDIPKMFQLMSKMQNGGNYTTINIFGEMGRKNNYLGLKDMFENLQTAELNRERLYIYFENENFPKDISILIRAKEDTSLWEGVDSLILFAKRRASEEMKKLKGIMNFFNMFLPWAYPTLIMTQLSYVFFEAVGLD